MNGPATLKKEERMVRWMHTLWFSGPHPEDDRYGQVIDRAVDAGFRFEGGTSAIEDAFVFDSERIEKLEEALRPFAALADVVDDLRHEDDSTCPHRLSAGDLRRARTALGSPSPAAVPEGKGATTKADEK